MARYLMQNLTIDRQCRLFTSRSELDQRVRFPVRMFSPVTGKTALCKDREALTTFLQDHIANTPRCYVTVEELLEWMLAADVPVWTRQSKHADAVRGIPYAETMIYMG